MSVWDRPPHTISSSPISQKSKKSQKVQRSQPLSQEEVDLAYRLEYCDATEAFVDRDRWMAHYHPQLMYMYNLFSLKMTSASIVLLTFSEFKRYVYENTERYFDPQSHKKICLLR